MDNDNIIQIDEYAKSLFVFGACICSGKIIDMILDRFPYSDLLIVPSIIISLCLLVCCFFYIYSKLNVVFFINNESIQICKKNNDVLQVCKEIKRQEIKCFDYKLLSVVAKKHDGTDEDIFSGLHFLYFLFLGGFIFVFKQISMQYQIINQLNSICQLENDKIPKVKEIQMKVFDVILWIIICFSVLNMVGFI